MSSTLTVEGFKKPDEKWKKMKAAWEACKAAGITVPDEIYHYFNYEEPDPAGVRVKIEGESCCKEILVEGYHGYEIDVVALPLDVTVIRIGNSY